MKFLDDILLEQTGSTPAVPGSNNFGILYASASVIHYRNSDSNFRLGYPTTSGVNVIYYTGSSGNTTTTYTWTKPPGCNFVRVFALGPGGGGGSGANDASGLSKGGTGGGGGALLWAQFLASDLPDSVTVTVPGCHPGGVGQSLADSTGFPGTSATSSYTAFGNFVSASGGDSGVGGTSNVSGITTYGALGGLISTCKPLTILAYGGCPGGWTSNLGVGNNAVYQGVGTTGVFNPTRGINSFQVGITSGGGAGGGAGGGRNTTSVAQTAGSGSGGNEYGVVKAGSTPGTATTSPNGANGQHNYINGYLQIATGSLIETYAPGQGGGGGAFPNGLGGHGGRYGAGGGGGGAGSTTGTPSGAGGSGSAGLCVVIEYL